MRWLALAMATVIVVGVNPPRVAEAASDRVVAASWVEGTNSLSGVLGYRTTHFTLYADGRLITPGVDDAHGVPSWRVATVTADANRRLRGSLARAIDDVDFGDIPVADIGYTRVRVVLDGRVLRARINALGMHTGLTEEQRRARERLERIILRAATGSAEPFAPETYEIRRITRGDPGIQLEWPGPALPAGDCGTIPAASYAAFPASYRQGNRYTWRGQQFDLWIRALLPGQRACRS